MREVFKGGKRKAGVMTLGLAILVGDFGYEASSSATAQGSLWLRNST
jgi:hypothetical protein